MSVKKNKIESVNTNKELLIKEKAIETSLSGIVISDMEGKFTYVNKSFVEMFGFKNKEEAFKITPLDIHPESEHKVVIDSLNIIKTIGSWKGELLAKKKNGELFNVQISTGLVKDELGNSICMMASFEDITQRKTAVFELKESEEKFRQISENIYEVFWLRSSDNKHILYINPAYELVWGRSCQSLYNNPNSFIDSVFKDDKQRVFNAFDEYLKTGNFDLDYRIVKPDGEIRWINARSFPVKDKKGNIINHTGFAIDITKRKKTEEKLRNKNEKLKLMYEELQTTNEMLEEANKEKVVLIKEIHHRVKNNLQTVQSILNMQKYYTDNESTMDLLDECINRIRSMSSIHQSLYETGNLAKIDMSEYIQELISHLHFSYAKDNCVIRFYNEIEKVYLNIEKAIPLGLILNEIITNCLKHAFKDRKFGKISIMLKNKNKKFELRVKDDGIGLPDNINVSTDINENYKTYGMSLISIFSNQLKAGIDIMRNNGTEFVLKFSS